jgi:hypothetical protein
MTYVTGKIIIEVFQSDVGGTLTFRIKVTKILKTSSQQTKSTDKKEAFDKTIHLVRLSFERVDL